MGSRSILVKFLAICFMAILITSAVQAGEEYSDEDLSSALSYIGLMHKACGDTSCAELLKLRDMKYSYYMERKVRDLLNNTGFIVEFKEVPLSVHMAGAGANGNPLSAMGDDDPGEDLPGMMAEEYRESLEETHEDFMDDLRSEVLKGNPGALRSMDEQEPRDFYTLFNGLAFSARLTEEQVLMILSHDGVKDIHVDRKVHALMADSLPMIGADTAHLLNDSLNRTLTGQGVTITIIDTGVDYTHPDLGSCTKPMFLAGQCGKVIGGYDFVNEDEDPMDDHGHGTHCAGISAGNGTTIGVAPDANIVAYKVLDSFGSGYTSDILAAMERAVDPNDDGNFSDRSDVVSMSLGGNGHYTDPDAIAADNAMDLGTVMVIAAGNDGPYNGSIKCPGCSRKSITVGAMAKEQHIEDLQSLLSCDSDGYQMVPSIPMEYSNLTDDDGVAGKMLDAGYGTDDDFDLQNFTGSIVLIRRSRYGEVSFKDMVNRSNHAGAIGVVIYNYWGQEFQGTLQEPGALPAVSITTPDGWYFQDLIQTTGANVTLVVKGVLTSVAEFSSRGPLSMYHKPDVIAPGVNICSTYPDGLDLEPEYECIDGRHASFSGTSMATPMVAGSVALLLQMHGNWTPRDVKAALESTAVDIGEDPIKQGNGKINITKAILLERPRPFVMATSISPVGYRDD